MRDRETGGSKGGILADEMGYVYGFVHRPNPLTIIPRLGKMVQILVRIADCKNEQVCGPTLLVTSTTFLRTC